MSDRVLDELRAKAWGQSVKAVFLFDAESAVAAARADEREALADENDRLREALLEASEAPGEAGHQVAAANAHRALARPPMPLTDENIRRSLIAERNKAQDFNIEAAARLRVLEAAGNAADDLLRRLESWDVMAVTADGGYWLREIAAVRAALSGGTNEPNQDAFLRAGGEVDTGGEQVDCDE